MPGQREDGRRYNQRFTKYWQFRPTVKSDAVFDLKEFVGSTQRPCLATARSF
jgi:hypothetical protein